MGKLQEIKDLEKRWYNEYNNYLKDAETIENEIIKIDIEIKKLVESINIRKLHLEPYMYAIHEFLRGIGNVAPVPDYKKHKPEYIPPYSSPAYIDTLNPKEYMNDSTLPDNRLKEELKIAGNELTHFFSGKYSTRIIKKAIENATVNKNNEKAKCNNDIGKRKDTLNAYKLKFEITTLYHDIIAEVSNTTERVILSEIPGIKAFLYAQGVKNAIHSGKLPSESRPVPLRRFMRTQAYKKHVNFVMNTQDFYTLFINYYQNDYLTQLLEFSNTGKVLDDKNEFINKKDIIKANVVFGG